MVGFKFEKLLIWQKAMEFGEDISKISRCLPKEEVFNLSSQMLRAVDSMPECENTFQKKSSLCIMNLLST